MFNGFLMEKKLNNFYKTAEKFNKSPLRNAISEKRKIELATNYRIRVERFISQVFSFLLIILDDHRSYYY